MADTKDLARRIVRAMEKKKYAIDRDVGEINIVYVEGGTISELNNSLQLAPNGNKENLWNDVRIALLFLGGEPHIKDWWVATTEPGTRYTMAPINEAGAARIALGQQKCWQVGLHRGYEALAQTGDAVMVTRDKNKDFSRTGDKVTKGFYGINQHHGHDADVNNIGPNSAGCLVGRTVKGHQEFMRLLKTDPRYIANKKHVFATTIMEAAEVLAAESSVTPQPSRPPSTAPAKMILKLTPANVKQCWPGAPDAIVDAFANDKEGHLAKAGILDTPQRFAFFAANLGHEVGDWQNPRTLVENTNYSYKRAAEVFGHRIGRTAADVEAKFGSAPGWQNKMFDEVYGSRMGNRPGTDDGSKFIGRGGPQITGRDGYEQVGKRSGLDLVNHPEIAMRPENQPAIAAAFWSWKKLNEPADLGDFTTVVKRWNGGLNGLPDRQLKLDRIRPIANKMERTAWTPEAVATTITVAVGTGATATVATQWYNSWGDVALIGGAAIVIATSVFFVVRHLRAPR